MTDREEKGQIPIREAINTEVLETDSLELGSSLKLGSKGPRGKVSFSIPNSDRQIWTEDRTGVGTTLSLSHLGPILSHLGTNS